MSTQLRKGDTGEATTNGGHFAAHIPGAKECPDLVAKPSAYDEALKTVTLAANKSGHGDVMVGVYEVILDRADDNESMSLAFGGFSAGIVRDDYIEHIYDAVLATKDWLLGHGGADVAGSRTWKQHIDDVCEDAGFSGVMPGFFHAALESADDEDSDALKDGEFIFRRADCI